MPVASGMLARALCRGGRESQVSGAGFEPLISEDLSDHAEGGFSLAAEHNAEALAHAPWSLLRAFVRREF